MFQSDLLDGLSRTPWWVVPVVWLPFAIATFGFGAVARAVPVGAGLAVAGLGWLCWTLAEYGLHRYFFHWQPNTSWGPKLHFIVHGVHHQWHQDPYRLVMPPAAAMVLCLVFGGTFAVLLGPVWFYPFFAGFVVGYVVYDCSHYAIHHLRWKNGVFQSLKKHHLLHHHSDPHKDRKFGVSTTLWDHVLRTF